MTDSGDKTTAPGRFLRPDFLNSFPFFSNLNSKMYRNMRKMQQRLSYFYVNLIKNLKKKNLYLCQAFTYAAPISTPDILVKIVGGKT